MELPSAPVAKIAKIGSMGQGVKRISEDAVETLVKILEEKAISITQQAIELAEHAGRDTVKEEDIKLTLIK